MFKKIIEEKKELFEKAVDHFKQETVKLRTGRANTALVESINVDYYGNQTPIKQLATINIPEARLITIEPWDKGVLPAIEKAIKMSELGLNPSNDGKLIRLTIPPLTNERREELVKVLNKQAEDARIAIRNIREETWKEIQIAEKKGLISEDSRFQAKDYLQKSIDEYNKKIDDLKEKKSEEIMTV